MWWIHSFLLHRATQCTNWGETQCERAHLRFTLLAQFHPDWLGVWVWEAPKFQIWSNLQCLPCKGDVIRRSRGKFWHERAKHTKFHIDQYILSPLLGWGYGAPCWYCNAFEVLMISIWVLTLLTHGSFGAEGGFSNPSYPAGVWFLQRHETSVSCCYCKKGQLARVIPLLCKNPNLTDVIVHALAIVIGLLN